MIINRNDYACSHARCSQTISIEVWVNGRHAQNHTYQRDAIKGRDTVVCKEMLIKSVQAMGEADCPSMSDEKRSRYHNIVLLQEHGYDGGLL